MLFATFAGYLAAGIPGAIVATVAVFLPSFVLVLVFARGIELVLKRRAVRDAIAGVTAAVVAVIRSVGLALAPAAVTDPLTAAVAMLAGVASPPYAPSCSAGAGMALAYGTAHGQHDGPPLEHVGVLPVHPVRP